MKFIICIYNLLTQNINDLHVLLYVKKYHYAYHVLILHCPETISKRNG